MQYVDNQRVQRLVMGLSGCAFRLGGAAGGASSVLAHECLCDYVLGVFVGFVKNGDDRVEIFLD